MMKYVSTASLPKRIRLFGVVLGSLDNNGHNDVIVVDEEEQLLLARRK